MWRKETSLPEKRAGEVPGMPDSLFLLLSPMKDFPGDGAELGFRRSSRQRESDESGVLRTEYRIFLSFRRELPNQKYRRSPISRRRDTGIASQTPFIPSHSGKLKIQIGSARKESP